MSTIAESLAALVSTLTLDDLPTEVVSKAKASLVHNLACALAGRGMVTPALNLSRLQSEGANWNARTLEGGYRVTPADAAFANGSLMHARTQDDFHDGANAHAGAVIIPAALALGEAKDASGAELICAIVGGYEVMIACGDPSSSRSTPRGFRSTCLYGPFGSAAAAARILGLDVTGTASAIALAASFAGGLTQPWLAGTFEYRVQAGEASRAGVVAALLAREGLRGAPDALEGKSGFYRAFTDSAEGTEKIASDLGRCWRILKVSFKFFPVSGIMQIPTHTIIELVRRHRIIANQVEAAQLEMNSFEYNYPGTARPDRCPDVGAALMSARFCLATAIRHGSIAYRHLQELDNPEQLSMMERIRVVPAEDLPHLSCRITLQMRDGRVLKAERKGGVNLAWNLETAERLARSLEPEMALPPGRLDAMIEIIRTLEKRLARDLIDTIV